MTIEQTEFRPGVTGELITNLHRRLELAGIAIPAGELADDHFGPGTEEAVRRFQATIVVTFAAGALEGGRRARSGERCRSREVARDQIQPRCRQACTTRVTAIT